MACADDYRNPSELRTRDQLKADRTELRKRISLINAECHKLNVRAKARMAAAQIAMGANRP